MTLLKSCCCWRSIRSGSFASGIYTMAFYTVVVIAGSFHVESIVNLPALLPVLTFSVMMLVLAAVTVLTSVILIVGLCTDNRMLLIPWIVSVSITTILDVVISLYMVTNSEEEMNPFFVVMDFLIYALNVYCILCVASQYQEFANDRNLQRQFRGEDAMPVIENEVPSLNDPSNAALIFSPELQPPRLDVCRSSFSSMTEISSDSYRESTLLQEKSYPGILSSGFTSQDQILSMPLH